jgi:hypothetical protein
LTSRDVHGEYAKQHQIKGCSLCSKKAIISPPLRQ